MATERVTRCMDCAAPIEGAVELCRFHAATGDLLASCQSQHEAIDRLFARLTEVDSDFMPSKSGQPWEALRQGKNAIERALGKRHQSHTVQSVLQAHTLVAEDVRKVLQDDHSEIEMVKRALRLCLTDPENRKMADVGVVFKWLF